MENKIFKRTLLGASVALLSTGVMAAGAESSQVGIISDFNVQAYGVAAISVYTEEDDTGYNFDNESRIGFRAGKDIAENVNVFMQIESGYVGDDGSSGSLGVRDTFLGLQGDWGKVRFGRMLTPLYEIVDWPYSNPGLGRVFDWGGDVRAHYDRKGDIARYDSPSWSGFSFNVSAGRGDTGTKDSNHLGAAAHWNIASVITLHAGYESNEKMDGSDIDAEAYIAGFELPLPAGFGLAGAYKRTEGGEYVDWAMTGQEAEQDSYSLIAQYWNGPWGVKVGYAVNENSEVNGVEQDNKDEVISGQLMYVVNGFVPYLRVGQHNAYSDNIATTDDKMFARVGLEYGF
jgi:predicted porin